MHRRAQALHQESEGAGQSEAAALHGMVVAGWTAHGSSSEGQG
jgi:hypothetical protein